jgi:hypothetical protein
MADLMVVKWYATVLRQNMFAERVAEIAPIALHYGATQYRVHVDNDDRYKINQMTWVPDHKNWYAFWEGPEMIEFRARWMGKYQIPITYAWVTEIALGGADAEVTRTHEGVAADLEDEPTMSATDSF